MRRILFLVLLLSPLAASPSTAQEARRSAKDYFDEGVARKSKGDWEGALADFSKALRCLSTRS